MVQRGDSEGEGDGGERRAHVSGRTTGGNLTSLATLVGSPAWDSASLDGAILVLEDVHEEPYRLDRMYVFICFACSMRRPVGSVCLSGLVGER